MTKSGKLVTVSQYVEGTKLSERLNASKSFWDETKVMNVFYQICLVVQYIHALGLSYKKINIKNILINDSDEIKLG